MLRGLIATLTLLAATTAAAEPCIVDAGPHDRIARGHDVVVEPGQTLDTAMAFDGNVIIGRGARVKTAVAVNGNVVLEESSKVTGTAATFGGKIQVASTAKIGGSRVQVGDQVRIIGENGRDLNLKLSIGGESLGKLVAAKLMAAAKSCKIEATSSSEVRL